MNVDTYFRSKAYFGFYKPKVSLTRNRNVDQKEKENDRREKRRATVNAKRNIKDEPEDAIENIPPPTKAELKRLQLMKWKKEKEEILLKNKKNEKKPFVVGIVHHKMNSPVTVLSNVKHQTSLIKNTGKPLVTTGKKVGKLERTDLKKKNVALEPLSPKLAVFPFSNNKVKASSVFKFKVLHTTSSKKLTKPTSPSFIRREATRKVQQKQYFFPQRKNPEEKKSSSDEELAVPLSPPIRVTRSQNQPKVDIKHVQIGQPRQEKIPEEKITEPTLRKRLYRRKRRSASKISDLFPPQTSTSVLPMQLVEEPQSSITKTLPRRKTRSASKLSDPYSPQTSTSVLPMQLVEGPQSSITKTLPRRKTRSASKLSDLFSPQTSVLPIQLVEEPQSSITKTLPRRKTRSASKLSDLFSPQTSTSVLPMELVERPQSSITKTLPRRKTRSASKLSDLFSPQTSVLPIQLVEEPQSSITKTLPRRKTRSASKLSGLFSPQTSTSVLPMELVERPQSSITKTLPRRKTRSASKLSDLFSPQTSVLPIQLVEEPQSSITKTLPRRKTRSASKLSDLFSPQTSTSVLPMELVERPQSSITKTLPRRKTRSARILSDLSSPQPSTSVLPMQLVEGPQSSTTKTGPLMEVKTEDEGTSISMEVQNGPSTPPNDFVLSPFVTVERGKRSSRRSSMFKPSPRQKISLRDAPAQDEPVDGPTFQKTRLNNETTRLLLLANDWEKIARLDDLDQNIIDDIDLVVGQTRLLTRDKFKQFRTLIEQHEADHDKIKVTLDDLIGFWDMMYLQVNGLNKKYEKLEALKSNNWIEPQLPLKKKAERPRTKKIVASAKSSLRDFIKGKKTTAEQNSLKKPALTIDVKKRRSSVQRSPAAYNALQLSFISKDYGRSPVIMVTQDMTVTPKSCLKIKPNIYLEKKSVRKTVLFSQNVEFELIESQNKKSPNNEERKNSDIETIFTPRRSSRLSIKNSMPSSS